MVWCCHKPPVGAGLLAKTAAHPTSLPTDPPLSRASSLPQCSVLTSGLVLPQTPCRSGLAREGVGTSQHLCRLIHRFREQARSHNALC
ncbi:hypothetical protein EVS84_25690 [Pseudomonas koreensis]|uniref:Uncharacterized protein n=1 Tax=Pseudomonas koreensis TaxID=198620 RepID=A0A4Q4KVK9_9PSED|nr:hypothetical protein EVS84_25690 [Pseudomonas koreensis]